MCPGAFSPPNHQPDNTTIGTPSDLVVPWFVSRGWWSQNSSDRLNDPWDGPMARGDGEAAGSQPPWLPHVGGNETIMVVWNICLFFHILGNNSPNWRTHIFQRGRSTTNQAWCTRVEHWIEHVQSRVLRWPAGRFHTLQGAGRFGDAVDQGNHNNGTQDSRAVGRILSQPWLWKVCYKLNIGRWWQTDRDSKIMIHKLGQPIILG